MSRRKLKIVNYDKDYVNVEDDYELRRFVASLEETHIGRRGSDWCARLLDEKDEEAYLEMLNRYFVELGAPEGCSRPEAIDYVLNAAIDREYAEKQNDCSRDMLKEKVQRMQNDHRDLQNPLNRLDYDSPNFVTHAKAICALLGIPDTHPNQKELMTAACYYIEKNLSQTESDDKMKTMELKDVSAGIAAQKNGVANFSAKVFRLISAEQLRECQAKINAALSEIQGLTIDREKKANLEQIKYGKG